MPEKAQELNALLDRFLLETRATLPKPNPDYHPPVRKPQRQEPRPGRQSLKSTVKAEFPDSESLWNFVIL